MGRWARLRRVAKGYKFLEGDWSVNTKTEWEKGKEEPKDKGKEWEILKMDRTEEAMEKDNILSAGE